jgi:hypothetical protein
MPNPSVPRASPSKSVVAGDRLLARAGQPAHRGADGYLDGLQVKLGPVRIYRDVPVDLPRLPAQKIQLRHVWPELRPLIA